MPRMGTKNVIGLRNALSRSCVVTKIFFMFTRAFVRSSLRARSAVKAVQFTPKVYVPSAPMSFSAMSSGDKDALRKQILVTSANATLSNPILKNIQLPQGLSPALSRIILPLIETSLENKNMSAVRKELQALVERTADPMENEIFEYELAEGTLENISAEILAALQELDSHRSLKKLPEIYDAFVSVYGQVSNERSVTVILPGKPTAKEVETLENELKAFYYKNMDIDLELKVRVDPIIGSGRIYCFANYMLDLTTTDFTKNLKEEMNSKQTELQEATKDLEDIFRKPLNADLPTSNTQFKAYTNKYFNSVYSKIGLAASEPAK